LGCSTLTSTRTVEAAAVGAEDGPADGTEDDVAAAGVCERVDGGELRLRDDEVVVVVVAAVPALVAMAAAAAAAALLLVDLGLRTSMAAELVAYCAGIWRLRVRSNGGEGSSLLSHELVHFFLFCKPIKKVKNI